MGYCRYESIIDLQTLDGKIWRIQIGHQSYVKSIRESLEAALCIRDMPSELVEKDNKPYIELSGINPSINPMILKPIYLCRSKKERFLIEPSVNSCRISFTIKKNDTLDELIAQKVAKMLLSRADRFQILRRKAVKDYDVSFLILTEHLEIFEKQRLIGVIMELIETIEKDLSEIKLSINQQCRIAATWFMSKIAEAK